jgi:Zn-dependent peptidase ImmA (M78 family)
MRRPDDSSLTPSQLAKVRKEAERALREAGALGRLPTPMDDIMAVARVQEVKEELLNESLISKLRAGAARSGQAVKKAVSKVLGLFHASEGLVFLNQGLMAVKRRFVGFHEAGHGFMQWQRKMYAVVEDCEKALDGETAELFDREANTFASEVLFQLDAFHVMACDKTFEIWTPVALAKKFGASNYAAIRQYVRKSDRACAVIVLNMPELGPDKGFSAKLRRVEVSRRFAEQFGALRWSDEYSPDDDIGALIPMGARRASGKRSLALVDQNDVSHECIAESFSTGYQVFILIHAVKTLTAVSIQVAEAS